MPWKEITAMSQRKEFVALALREGAKIRELCRAFGISPTTGYKWLKRYLEGGEEALVDRSRRPRHSPNRTSEQVEQVIVGVRDEHPTWGGRKIRATLDPEAAPPWPVPSTITAILRRYHRLDDAESAKHRPFQRFEMLAPNELWQMDFKGHFPMTGGGRCHPVTVLDDHSRFLLGLRACPDETRGTVQDQVTRIMRQYGLPDRILTDNGPPWGSAGGDYYTAFMAWLIQLGIRCSHSRPCHPQTLGKDERLQRTLKEDLISRQQFVDLADCQAQFDAWRDVYNLERPHEALRMDVPLKHYRPSPRPFPEKLPEPEYNADDIVRKVYDHGRISYHNRHYHVGRAFIGHHVALRPTLTDGVLDVHFYDQRVARITLVSDNTDD